MKNENLLTRGLLKGCGVSVVDAARLVCNILDLRDGKSTLSPLLFCAKVVEAGKCSFRFKEMSVAERFAVYLNQKEHLRPDSMRDIKYLGKRLLKAQ